ncbi:MAG: hypothetical protein MSA45_02130 [Firmicutes bacterium]|nr:hypothetical protein [Bacillota bacterium]
MLFGACNQLAAVPAFLAAACRLKKAGKKHSMFYIPMVFMLITSGSASGSGCYSDARYCRKRKKQQEMNLRKSCKLAEK